MGYTPLESYRPDRMLSGKDSWVPHLNVYKVGIERFPPGETLQMDAQSIAQTLRRVWEVAKQTGFVVSDQIPPVLPVTPHWIDASTPHGSLQAERSITILPAGLLDRQRYQSSALLLTIDAAPGPASAPDATLESVVPHTATVQVGNVFSVMFRGKHHQWRDITSVEPDPVLAPDRQRLVEALKALP